jgi:hypothetical protein
MKEEFAMPIAFPVADAVERAASGRETQEMWEHLMTELCVLCAPGSRLRPLHAVAVWLAREGDRVAFVPLCAACVGEVVGCREVAAARRAGPASCSGPSSALG